MREANAKRTEVRNSNARIPDSNIALLIDDVAREKANMRSQALLSAIHTLNLTQATFSGIDHVRPQTALTIVRRREFYKISLLTTTQ